MKDLAVQPERKNRSAALERQQIRSTSNDLRSHQDSTAAATFGIR